MAVEVKTQTVPPVTNGTVTKLHSSPKWNIPPSDWTYDIHPRADEVIKEVDGYFLEHWNFADEKARKTFIKAGFSHVTCLYFPLAKDDRIHFACRLLTFLFLIDGMFSWLLDRHLSFSVPRLS